jgi:hypothetical protein
MVRTGSTVKVSGAIYRSLLCAMLYAFHPALYAIDNFSFSGFGSLGMGKINRDDVKFMGYDDSWSFRSDTMLGLQAQADISDRWSATTQIVSRGFNFDDTSDFEPTLEWLFASYQVSPEARIRFGRMRTPLYLLSESLEVGYSYPWVRPPVDTYTFLLTSLSNFNGVDLSTNVDFGNSDLDIQVFAGASQGKYIDFDLDFYALFGANFKYHWNSLTLRYGVTIAKTDASSASLDPIIDAYQQFAALDPIFAELADSHSTEGAWFHYHGLGLQWDYGHWSLIAEQYATLGPNEDFSNDSYGGYISLSRQIGKFTPYAVIGYYKNVFSDDISTLITQSEAIIPPGNVPQLDGLREIDQQVANQFDEDGRTYTLGLRYELFSQAALKLEVEYFDSNALMSGENLNQKPDETVLTSIVIDVVF